MASFDPPQKLGGGTSDHPPPALQRSKPPPPFPLQGASFPKKTVRPEPHGFCMDQRDLRIPEEGYISTSMFGPRVWEVRVSGVLLLTLSRPGHL